MKRSMSFSGLHVPDTRASQRRSFAGRISHRVASGLSFANPSFHEERTGTVVGTIINTLCSVIGAGVLSLPLALYFSSILVGLALLLFLSSFAAFSVYLLVVGCDATGRYSITEVVAFALYPPQLWEEFLYQRGKEGADAPASAGGVSAADTASLHTRGERRSSPGSSNSQSSSRSSSRNAAAAASASAADERPSRTQQSQPPAAASSRDVSGHGVGDASSTVADTQDAGRDARRSSRRHRHPQQQHVFDGSQAGAAGEEHHFTSPPTSAYAGLRNTYARQEWYHRRCRRVVTMLIEFIIFCSNYGTLVIYSKVIADSMPPVVSYITHTDGIFVSKYFWLVAGGVVFFVLSCARNMEELKWSSLLGFLTIFYIVVVILYRYHTQHVRDYPHVDPAKYGTINWMRLSVKMLQTVSAFGVAFSYHYNVPYFYKELQNRRPRSMMASIAVAFPIIIACYALTGVFGYLTLGDEVANKKVGGNIVSNYPKGDLPMNIGRLGLFAHFACVFPVVSICTRRGLHRLTMIGLTWAEQSALMREAAVAAGAVLTAEEAAAAAAYRGEEEDEEDEGAGMPGETSPLLHTASSATTTAAPAPPGYEVFASSSPQQNAGLLGAGGSITSPTGAGAAGQTYHSMSDSSNTDDGNGMRFTPGGGPPGTVDVDRDVGSPDLTTTLAIVVEAAFLVVTTVLLAATVSGIDFVIHIIGTLFSVFIVMVAPGIVGWCVFSPTGPFGSAAAAAAAYSTRQEEDQVSGNVRASDVAINGASSRYRFIRLKQLMCLVNAVLGCLITGIGVAVLIYDTVKGARAPTI